MKRVTIRIPDSLQNRIDSFAADEDSSDSEAARMAMDRGLMYFGYDSGEGSLAGGVGSLERIGGELMKATLYASVALLFVTFATSLTLWWPTAVLAVVGLSSALVVQNGEEIVERVREYRDDADETAGAETDAEVAD
jgi:hypothetical protein